MSIADHLPRRSGGKHRCLTTRSELKAKNKRLDEENNDLTCFYVRAKTDLHQTASELGACVVENQELRARVAELEQTARWAVEAKAGSLFVAALGERDVAPDDLPTEPAGINVQPLWEALGHEPSRPAVVSLDLGEERFAGTARISA